MSIVSPDFLGEDAVFNSCCCQDMIHFFKGFSKLSIIFCPKTGGKYWTKFILTGNTVYLLILFTANI